MDIKRFPHEHCFAWYFVIGQTEIGQMVTLSVSSPTLARASPIAFRSVLCDNIGAAIAFDGEAVHPIAFVGQALTGGNA